MKDPKALSCIKCEKELTNVTNDKNNQPYDGLSCTTYGHYGSRVFDPHESTEHLEFSICDDCMIEVARKHLVQHVHYNGRNSVVRIWTGK